MVLRKTVCLRRLGSDRAGELRAGRFFASPKVTAEKIISSWGQQTSTAVAGRHVLAIDDTCEVRFPTTAQRRRGLGPIGHGNIYGVLVHAMIGVDADSGACLGLVGGQVWTRPGTVNTPHGERPPEARESSRWLATAEQAKAVLRQAAMVTVVDDRESDIYAKWAMVPTTTCHLLTRACNDRRLAGGSMLFATMAAFPTAGQRQIQMPARDPGRPKRAAVLRLRYGEAVIRRPRGEWDRSLPTTVTLRCIELRELDPPADAEPLHWRLLTTHQIGDAAAAWRIVGWYRLRWVIEQLFRTMKSHGLQLEGSQVASAERLVKLAAIATKAACIDMQLVQEREGRHQLPASVLLSEPEIDTLVALTSTLEGNTDRQRNPHPIRSLAWAAWTMARLGGWNCYYKPPGPITMHRGTEQFYAIHCGRLIRASPEQDVRIP